MQEMPEKFRGITRAFREVRLRRFVSRRSSEASRREVSSGRSAEEVSRGREGREGGREGGREARGKNLEP